MARQVSQLAHLLSFHRFGPISIMLNLTHSPLRLYAVALFTFWVVPATAADPEEDRSKLAELVNARVEIDWDAAQKIWKFAEPGYQEKKSSALLVGMFRGAGFEVEYAWRRFRPRLPRPWVKASRSSESWASTTRCPGSRRRRSLSSTAGRGDLRPRLRASLFGVASASASIALAQLMRENNLKGTIRYYGCPAEEGGGAKAFMVAAGLFNDCDAVLHWHPSSTNSAGDRSTLARIAAKFRFHGKAAHAAGAPDQGRSALDAVELTNHAAQLLREHTPDGTPDSPRDHGRRRRPQRRSRVCGGVLLHPSSAGATSCETCIVGSNFAQKPVRWPPRQSWTSITRGESWRSSPTIHCLR